MFRQVGNGLRGGVEKSEILSFFLSFFPLFFQHDLQLVAVVGRNLEVD